MSPEVTQRMTIPSVIPFRDHRAASASSAFAFLLAGARWLTALMVEGVDPLGGLEEAQETAADPPVEEPA